MLLDTPYNPPVSPVAHPRPPCRCSGRILWATMAFLAGFGVLIWIVSTWYLIPAMEAAQDANNTEKQQLAASSRLLLAVVLFILLAGILLTFRFGRYFLPRQAEKAK